MTKEDPSANDAPPLPAPASATSASAIPGAAAEAARMRSVLCGMLAMLAHDLRTPLSAMTAWLYLLDSDKLDAEARKRALQKIRASVEDQVQLIDDAVLLSRCEAASLHLEMAPVSALVPLAAATESVRPAALAKGIELAAPEDHDCGIQADGELLERAFRMLLEQALKNTPAGGAVRTTVRPRDGWVEISIIDNGRGVSADALPHLLDPFARQNDDVSGRPPAMERRLLLAKALLEAHGGRLAVTSPGEGMGTTFTVELPSPGAGG